MKKGVILVLILLFSFQLVNAQEIKVFGKSYSLILAAPIAFIGIIMLFFLGMIIKDNIGKIKLPKIHFKKQEKKEFKIDHLTKFNIIKHKLGKINNEQEFDEFINIVKDFFKDKLNIKHEFSFAEFNNLVKGHVKEADLSSKISNLKYSGASITTDQIKDLFQDFELILKDYKIKEIIVKESKFTKIKNRILSIFKKKEVKHEIKIKKEIIPKIIPKVEIKKVSIFSRLKLLFKKDKIKKIPIKKESLFSKLSNLFKKDIKIQKTNIKPIIKNEIKKEIEEVKPKKEHKFLLFDNIKNKILRIKISNLIKKGERASILNPLLAKRYYARALLNYYRLPIEEEKDMIDKLIKLHNNILMRRNNEKVFLDVSMKLIKTKHQGKQVSRKGIDLVKTLHSFIEKEELLAATKLKQISHKLIGEKRKLSYFIKYHNKFGNFLNNEIRLIKKDEINLKNFIINESESIIDRLRHNINIFIKKIHNTPKSNNEKFFIDVPEKENVIKNLKKHEEIRLNEDIEIKRENILNKIRNELHVLSRKIKNLEHKEKKAISNINDEVKEIVSKLKYDLGSLGKNIWNLTIKEEREIKKFIENEAELIMSKLSYDIHKFGRMIHNLTHSKSNPEELINQTIKKEELMPKQEIMQKTINIMDRRRINYPHKLNLNPNNYIKDIKDRKIMSLEKQRMELYNKLLELEGEKLTHDKLN